jgi:DNA-binding NtrC family response regulator
MRRASIFLVEDETLIRMMLAQIVEELGHRVVAEAASVDDGRSRAEIVDYDLAILDINLQGFNVLPVAQAISQRGLPFFFLTGYGSKGVPDEYKGLPVLDKPCTAELLKSTIDAVLSHGEARAEDNNGRRASQT